MVSQQGVKANPDKIQAEDRVQLLVYYTSQH